MALNFTGKSYSLLHKREEKKGEREEEGERERERKRRKEGG